MNGRAAQKKSLWSVQKPKMNGTGFFKKISAYRNVYFEYMIKLKGMHTFIYMAKE